MRCLKHFATDIDLMKHLTFKHGIYLEILRRCDYPELFCTLKTATLSKPVYRCTHCEYDCYNLKTHLGHLTEHFRE